MTRDNSVPDTVSDEDVEFTIKRLHEYKSAMGDPDGEIATLIRVFEILYGVSYDDFNHDDLGRMHRVIHGISPEEATRLDPVFVDEARECGFETLIDINDRVKSNGFECVPLIGRGGSQ